MRKMQVLTAIILIAAMLSGCALPSFRVDGGDLASSVSSFLQDTVDTITESVSEVFDTDSNSNDLSREEMQAIREEAIVPFSEMVYTRPDVDGLIGDIHVLEDALEEGTMKLKEIEELIDVVYADYYTFSTNYNLANVHNNLNMVDEYYAEEYAWCDEQSAVVQDMIDEMYFACGGSKYAQDLEDDYFWEGFAEEYADIADSMYTPELVALMQEEADILAEYRALVAEPTVTVDGEEVGFEDGLENASTAQRYYAILFGYYDKYNPLIADLFIRLIHVRNEMAKEAGYDSYEAMQYDYYYERDYTAEQAGAYIDDIRTYIVPLAEEIGEKYSYYDINFGSVNEKTLYDVLDSLSEEVGGHVREAYEFMIEYGLSDLSYSTKKSGMSFQTYFSDYEAPFLLISAERDIRDVLTTVHEFGHYSDGYTTFDAPETIDLAECFSQSLEYLSLDRYDGLFSKGTVKNLRIYKLVDTVSLYTQQASFAEFEREVYALPEDQLNAETFNEISLRLAEEFGYLESGYESYYSRSWIDISHFFEAPFYVISYPVSNDVALQIYGLEREEQGAGVAKFLEMLEHESEYLIETVEEYGLKNPMDEGSVKEAAELIRDMLNDIEG